jgi:ATP/maltotriose-dependent transcriptional regulator MalT
MGSAAETRLALAELACDTGRSNEAKQLARDARKVFQAQNQAHDEILAAALLSRPLLDQGKLAEAAASLDVLLKVSEKISDVTTRLSLTLAHANVLAGAKDLAAAERAARKVLAEAPKDLVWLRLEASLTLAEIQSKGKNAAEGHRRLQEVSRAAREKGFELIVHQASAPQL